MSTVVIRNFVNTYNHVLVSACKHKNITFIPFPKYPINTDDKIQQYSSYLDNYVRTGNVKKTADFELKPVVKKFPKEYFNYESF